MATDPMLALLLGQGGQRGQSPRRAVAARLMQPQAPQAPLPNSSAVLAHALTQGLNALTGNDMLRQEEREDAAREEARFQRVAGYQRERRQQNAQELQGILGGMGMGGGGQAAAPPVANSPPLSANDAAPAGGDFYATLRGAESGGDPNARNPRSTATGHFQFIDSTWREFANANPDLFAGMTPEQVMQARTDPVMSLRAAEWYARQNGQALRGAGQEPTPANLALAHTFGPGGARTLLGADPNAPVDTVLPPQVIAANPHLRGQTVGQVVGGFGQRYAYNGQPGASPPSGPPSVIPQPPPSAGPLGIDPRLAALATAAANGNEQAAALLPILTAQLNREQPRPAIMGNRIVDPRTGNVIRELPPEPSDTDRLFARWRELSDLGERATPTQAQERDMLQARLRGSSTNINLGGSTQVGTIPPGFQLSRTPDGTIRMEPIPGGPADRDAAERARAEDARRTNTNRQGNIVVQDVDRILGLMDNSWFPVSGAGGSLLSRIPGTAAADVARMLETLGAEAAFGRLQSMRESSPTGGALGAVTERELALLQATMGSLAQSQSAQQFRDNLNRFRNTYLDIVHGPGQGPPRARLSFEQREGQQQGPQPGTARRVTTPEEAAALPPGTEYETPDGRRFVR